MKRFIAYCLPVALSLFATDVVFGGFESSAIVIQSLPNSFASSPLLLLFILLVLGICTLALCAAAAGGAVLGGLLLRDHRVAPGPIPEPEFVAAMVAAHVAFAFVLRRYSASIGFPFVTKRFAALISLSHPAQHPHPSIVLCTLTVISLITAVIASQIMGHVSADTRP